MGERGIEKRIFGRPKKEEVSPAELKVRKYEEKMVEREWEKTAPEANTKEIIKAQAPAEIERRLTDYAKEWYSKHDKTIQHAGYDPETKDIGEIRRATEELGGFNELFTKEKFFGGKKYENIVAPLCVLAGVSEKIKEGKEPLRLDEMRGILYLLNERANTPRERLKEEIRAIPPEDKEEISEQELEKAVDEELKALFEARKDLAQKINPERNLEKESSEKGEKKYIDTTFSRMFGDFQKEDYKNYLTKKGYTVREEAHLFAEPFRPGTEKRGTLSIAVVDSEGTESKLYTGKELKEEELINFLKEKTFDKVEPEFKKEWEELGPAEKDKVIKDLIGKEIEKAAKPIEMAKGKGFEFWKKGPEVVYGTIKDRLAKEAIEKKTKEEKEKELEKFKEAGIDIEEKLLNPVITGKDKNVKKFSGDAKKDFKYARRFAEGMGLPLDRDNWEEFNEAMKKIEVPYSKKIVENPSFLLLWWINLINFIIGRQEGIETKLEKFGTET